MSNWTTKSSRVAYENPWLTVHEDEVVMPDGRDGMYGVVSSKNDAVFIVPVDSEGNTYLVEQEHYTTRETALQCVAGRIDNGESPEEAAKRELLEEAGLDAKNITVLSRVRTASGMTTFRSTIFLATNLTEDMSKFDSSEIDEVKKVPLESIPDMVLGGEIATTESIASLLTALEFLKKHEKQSNV